MKRLDVVMAYNKLCSLDKVSVEFGISEAKVRKILITEGVYENDTSKQVKKLYDKGKTTQEIAKILKLSKSCINMYLPYKKGVYRSEYPTINALRIRKCRNKIK